MTPVDPNNPSGEAGTPQNRRPGRQPKKVARYGTRFVEIINREKIGKELNRPLKKLSRIEKAARRKLLREQRRMKKEIQATQAAQEARIPKEKIGDIYDIVVEIAREAENATDPIVAQNLTQHTIDLMKILDQYHERESERHDDEHRLDMINDEHQRKKRAQEQLAKEKAEKELIQQNQSPPRRRPKKRTRI